MADTGMNNAGKVIGDWIASTTAQLPEPIRKNWWVLALVAAFIVFYYLKKKKR